MPSITLAQAEAKLAVWMDAEETLATSQSYEIGDRKLTRADLAEVGKRIEYWNNKVKVLSAVASGRNRTVYVVR